MGACGNWWLAALVLMGQPTDVTGFRALVAQLPDRTTVTYDPWGLGRSTRKDGRTDHDPEVQASDMRAVIEAVDVGAVDLFARSGGAATALARGRVPGRHADRRRP